jgi:hypothetical protein
MREKARIGRFVIHREILWDFPNIARQIMAKMIILDARYEPSYDGVMYTAISEIFDLSPMCCEPKHYEIIFNVNSGNITTDFYREEGDHCAARRPIGLSDLPKTN